MPAYLVTGRAGSGKSAVTRELRKRGFEAFDTDEMSGLSSWVDQMTGEKITFADNSFVDKTRYQWLWDETVLRTFLNRHQSVFLCGGADNDFDFENQFDKHFVLSVTPEVQIQRVRDRSDNEYGKDPRMYETIVNDEAEHVKTARERNIVVIDANQPIDKVVDKIIEQL